MQSRDRDAFELMLGAVAELLHRVPADPALGDVAMHVVGKAQVFIDSDAVAGRAGLADPACADGVRAFLRARFTAWPHLPPVGVEDVARRVEGELLYGDNLVHTLLLIALVLDMAIININNSLSLNFLKEISDVRDIAILWDINGHKGFNI